MILITASDYTDVKSLLSEIAKHQMVLLDLGDKSVFVFGQEASKQFIADRILRRIQDNPEILTKISDALNDDIKDN